jgi:hypothetical protein
MADGKWIGGLSPEMPVADAAARVLRGRFKVVRELLPLAAARAWEDSEYVHQLRVGTRRAGAALRVFAAALPRKRLRAMKVTLAVLRRAAGDARDWDVFLAALPASAALEAEAAAPARDFLTGYAFGQRTAAQAHLAAAIDQYGEAFREQSEALPDRAREPRGDGAPATFGALAGWQLGTLLRELTEAAEANPTDPRLARAADRRQAVAVRDRDVRRLLPAGAARDRVPAVERVQEVLGEVQGRGRRVWRGWPTFRCGWVPPCPGRRSASSAGWTTLAAELRARVPAGRAAFAAWREEWLELVAGLKLEALATVAS